MWAIEITLVCMSVRPSIPKDIDGLVQESRNSSALAMELHLSCNNPLISDYVITRQRLKKKIKLHWEILLGKTSGEFDYGNYTALDTGLILGLRPANEGLLLCNNISHWLGANLESALRYMHIMVPNVTSSGQQEAYFSDALFLLPAKL